MRARWTVLVAGLLAAVAPAQAAGDRARRELDELREAVGFDPVPGSQLPLDARFSADDGRPITLGEAMAGRPTVLALVYYECPVLCNEVVNALMRSLAALRLEPGADYSVILLGIDPEEGPAHATRRRALIRERSGGRAGGAGWSLLTGEERQIARVADAVGFRFRYVPEADEYAHASGITLIAPDGTLSRAFRGIDYPPRDLRLGLVDSSRGEVGSVADRLLLLCYRWDPTAGRYGFAVDAALKLGALCTVLGLVAGIGGMLWRERRRRRPT